MVKDLSAALKASSHTIAPLVPCPCSVPLIYPQMQIQYMQLQGEIIVSEAVLSFILASYASVGAFKESLDHLSRLLMQVS